ncbi:MAG TPA: aldehyde dehydrogenase family protein [candidate division Zixibacteria bacterium]|nr:aldehyde dehydrogenase family protein [candidate division Zixibacteria bacterium]
MTTEVRAPTVPIYLAGEFVEAGTPLEVRNPASGELVATTFQAGPEELERATVAAVEAFQQTCRLASYQRRDVLAHVAQRISEEADELADLLTAESGKPIKDARGEVARASLTFRTAGEEALRITGEWLPLDWNAANRGRSGIVRRYPIGPVAGISPFNFPLNLAAHKVAPAIAAGCSIVLKPPSKDPLVMLRVARYLDETDLPAGAVSILPMDRPTGDAMVGDERFKLLSFTGSPSVGWKMKAAAGKKKVVLELGGNAGAVVDETADLDWAVSRLVFGAFAYAGQVCISVQRIYVVEAIWDAFVERFTAAVRQVKVGDPRDPATDLGPMVDRAAVERTREWVNEALERGARALVGGEPDGQFYPPTVLVDVPKDARVCGEEVFAPVVNLFPVPDFATALREINDSRFGLQCGLFTNDLERTLTAHDELEVGGVIVNDIPTWRIDPMPYGGVKDSGLGREGLRYSIEDMTEPRLLAFARPL